MMPVDGGFWGWVLRMILVRPIHSYVVVAGFALELDTLTLELLKLFAEVGLDLGAILVRRLGL